MSYILTAAALITDKDWVVQGYRGPGDNFEYDFIDYASIYCDKSIDIGTNKTINLDNCQYLYGVGSDSYHAGKDTWLVTKDQIQDQQLTRSYILTNNTVHNFTSII